ncbi:MAG TPA: hypothetical protein VMX54_13985 [Vicinamibacteria bacterium]|nr:hypothetical protein [Vicinamibacteria bacterium]
MKRLLAVTARELRERWLLFPASLVLGLNPLVFPAFGVDRREMPFVGVVAAVGLAAAAAVIMGSTMLARDAANGRLGFLFSRPLSWRTIWGGKWLAALVLVAGSGLLAAIPFMVVYPPGAPAGLPGSPVPLVSWLGVLAREHGWVFGLYALMLGVGVANLLATAYRSRSPWVVGDMVLAAAAVWIARRRVAPLWLLGGLQTPPPDLALAVVLLPLAIGLLAGSAAQVAIGRTDPRRAHLALSLTFWAVVYATLAGAAGRLAWIEAAGPADLRSYDMAREANGRWLFVAGESGRARWFGAGFLLDTTSGNYLQVTPSLSALALGAIDDRVPSFPQSLSFSADGRYAAFWEPDTARGSTALVRVLLSTGTPRRERVGLASTPPPGWWTALALSATGGHAVLVSEAMASLHELPAGRAAATCALAPGWRAMAIRFLDEDAARVWLVLRSGVPRPTTDDEIRILDISNGGGCRATAFTVPPTPSAPARPTVLTVDATGKRLLTSRDALALRDGATGALLSTLVDSGVMWGRFLGDGRIAAIAASESGSVLRIFSPEGRDTTTAALEHKPSVLGPEIAPGRVVVPLGWRWPQSLGSYVVDATDGRVVQRFHDLTPPLPAWWLGDFTQDPDLRTAARAVYLTDADGRLWRLDGRTGERRVVAGPGAPRGRRLD